MTCKDCIHRCICKEHERLMLTIDNLYELMYEEGVDKFCEHFRNKADFVEAVKCKDCKHWNCVSRVTEHMGCDIFCDNHGREYPTNPDDFCSYGKRKEGQSDE